MKYSPFKYAAIVMGSAAFIALAPGIAQSKSIESEDFFCEGLAKESSYKGSSLNHLAILIPGRDGWIFRTNNDFRKDWETSPQTLEYIKKLKTALEKNNAQLVFIIPPVRGLTAASVLTSEQRTAYGMADTAANWAGYQKMINDIASTGVVTVGIDPAKAQESFFYKRNHHWSPEGARIMAQAVAEKLAKNPFLKSMPKEEFITEKVGEEDYKSSFEKAFKTICKTKVPDEKINIYETQPSQAVQSEENMFGEKETPNVILLGTSNSVNDASKSNFEGFLKEYLSVDIDNRAVTGAGMDSSIISYLNSPAFKKPDKKLILWEIPGYYNLNIMDDKVFNQVIPAAYGECKTPLLNTQIGPVTQRTVSIFDWSGQDKSAGSIIGPAQASAPEAKPSMPLGRQYLRIKFDKPVKSSFNVNFQFNDMTKKQQFSRDPGYEADGIYYTLIPAAAAGDKLNGITLSTKKKLPKANITVCEVPA